MNVPCVQAFVNGGAVFDNREARKEAREIVQVSSLETASELSTFQEYDFRSVS